MAISTKEIFAGFLGVVGFCGVIALGVIIMLQVSGVKNQLDNMSEGVATPSELDKSFDNHPCPNGKRLKIANHNDRLKDIIATMGDSAGFCLHNHNIMVIDVEQPGKVGLRLSTIPVEYVDQTTQAHVICDEDDSIHSCVPASNDVHVNVHVLMVCGWLVDTYSNECFLTEGQACTGLFDHCENSGSLTSGFNCLDGTCSKCGPAETYTDNQGLEQINMC